MSNEYDTHDDMTTADTFTSDELAEMERDDELYQDALDEARYAAEDDGQA